MEEAEFGDLQNLICPEIWFWGNTASFQAINKWLIDWHKEGWFENTEEIWEEFVYLY